MSSAESSNPQNEPIAPPPASLAWGIAWPILLVAGLVVWIILLVGDPGRAMRALLVNFIYFTPLAAGMVVWSAVIIGSRGYWAGRLELLTLSGMAFAPLSILALIGLWIGADHWAPWLAVKDDRAIWFNKSFLFIRDMVSLVVFWVLAFLYVRRRRYERCKTLGAWLIVVFSLAFTLLAFDLVMALDPGWRSTAFGMYFFVSAMYVAAMAWALIAAWRPGWNHDRLHDLGKIILAFGILTTYLVYAHLYPMWYENLPAEIRFLVPRMNYTPWKYISWVILLLGWLGPLWMLLAVLPKRNRVLLTIICLIILAVMWIERWWLVNPTITLDVQLGWPEFAMLVAMLGGIGLSIEEYLHRVPLGEIKEPTTE